MVTDHHQYLSEPVILFPVLGGYCCGVFCIYIASAAVTFVNITHMANAFPVCSGLGGAFTCKHRDLSCNVLSLSPPDYSL